MCVRTSDWRKSIVVFAAGGVFIPHFLHLRIKSLRKGTKVCGCVCVGARHGGFVITSTAPVARSVCVHLFVRECGLKMAADCATTQQAEQHDDN